MHAPMHSSRISMTGAVMAVAALLLLSGCASESDEAESGAAGGSTSSSDDATSNDSDTNDSNAEDSSSETLVGKKCLPGNWFLDNAEFAALMSSVSGKAVDKVAGTVMLTLTPNGTTKTFYENWSHTISVDGGATITIVKDGVDSGTYTVTDGGSMSLIDTNISSTTVSKMKINGSLVTTAVSPAPSVFSQASFTCVGDELTVTAEGATTVMHREH